MTIRIDGLTFEAIIGILDHERLKPQRVRVDCEIEYDGEYVDYAVVRDILMDTIQQGAFGLIEDALAALVPKLHVRFPQIRTMTLQVAKPDIFSDCSVSVRETVSF